MHDYQYWQDALAGKKPLMYVDSPMCGFFRMGTYTKEPNKARKRTGWTPVAVFVNNGEFVAVIGDKTITDRDRINEAWSYFAGHPISEETYRAVAERGEGWPDSHETAPSLPVANASGSMPLMNRADDADTVDAAINEASAQIEKYATIDSDEMSSKARSLQQKFLDLRSEAKKQYDALNDPLLAEQKRIRAIWFPIRDRADDGATKLRDAMGRWEDTKRKAAKISAERAKAGQVVQANVPPPSTQIQGGTGRAASVKVEVFVTSIDVDKVFEQFKTSLQVIELLTSLAQKAIRAGIAVPGAVTEERSVIK